MANLKVKDLPIEITPTVNDFLVMDKADGSATEKVLITQLQSLINNTNMVLLSQTLTPAQIKTLNSVPVDFTAAPAPVDGSAWVLMQIIGSIAFVSQAYTSYNISIKTDTAANTQGQTINLLQNTYNAMTTGILTPYIGSQIIPNKKLVFQADSDSLVGDSPVTIYAILTKITP